MKARQITFHARDRAVWRSWLTHNHLTTQHVWLVIYHKDADMPSIYYDEAVDEALCFGWIDSKPNKRDHQSYFQYFSMRNPKSNWSKVNKLKVTQLSEEGRMAEAGLAMIRTAKETGTWSALEEVDNLILPDDLKTSFAANPEAFDHWQKFPPSSKRNILEWIFNARLPTTRTKRINEAVKKASQDIRANHYRQPLKRR